MAMRQILHPLWAENGDSTHVYTPALQLHPPCAENGALRIRQGQQWKRMKKMPQSESLSRYRIRGAKGGFAERMSMPYCASSNHRGQWPAQKRRMRAFRFPCAVWLFYTSATTAAKAMALLSISTMTMMKGRSTFISTNSSSSTGMAAPHIHNAVTAAALVPFSSTSMRTF